MYGMYVFIYARMQAIVCVCVCVCLCVCECGCVSVCVCACKACGGGSGNWKEGVKAYLHVIVLHEVAERLPVLLLVVAHIDKYVIEGFKLWPPL